MIGERNCATKVPLFDDSSSPRRTSLSMPSRSDGRETSSFCASSRSAASFSPGLQRALENELLDVGRDCVGDFRRAYGKHSAHLQMLCVSLFYLQRRPGAIGCFRAAIDRS